jgi:hypothetical protein
MFLQGILKQYDSSNIMCIASIKPCQSALLNKHYPLNGEAPLQLQNDILKKKVYNKYILFNLKFYGSQNCRFLNTICLVTTKFVSISHAFIHYSMHHISFYQTIYIFKIKAKLESYASLTNWSEGLGKLMWDNKNQSLK